MQDGHPDRCRLLGLDNKISTTEFGIFFLVKSLRCSIFNGCYWVDMTLFALLAVRLEFRQIKSLFYFLAFVSSGGKRARRSRFILFLDVLT